MGKIDELSKVRFLRFYSVLLSVKILVIVLAFYTTVPLYLIEDESFTGGSLLP